jgi:very-short-patch-repair endonuclease
MTLLLAAGEDATASHCAAARLLGIPGFANAMPEITTPRPRRHRTHDGIVHRSRALPWQQITVINGIRTTRIARMLFDIAGILNPDLVERTLDTCLANRWVTNRQIGNIVGELGKRGRRGTRLMRQLLLDRGEGYVATASELEARFAKLCREYGLPEPVRQQNTGDAEKWIARVDFAYPRLKIIIELDGRRHWLAKLEHEADLTRDAKLTAAGWHVIHFTWKQITQEPEFVVAILRQLLDTAAA